MNFAPINISSNEAANNSQVETTQQEPAKDLILKGVDNFDGDYYARPVEETAFLQGLKQLSAKPEKGNRFAFVVEGCGGSGKTTIVSHVLHNNTAYIRDECNFGIVLWLNCYDWKDGIKKNREKQAFLKKLLALGSQLEPEGGFNSLKTMTDYFAEKSLRILFVFDDIFHYSVLEKLGKEIPNVFCCAITRDGSKLKTSKFDPFLKREGVVNPLCLSRLSDDQVLEVLKGSNLELASTLTCQELRKLIGISRGLPLLVSLMGAYFQENKATGYSSFISGVFGKGLGRTTGEDTASELFIDVLSAFTHEERQRYYAFLLFNPGDKVAEECLRLLWNFDDVEKTREVCAHWEQLSLVRHVQSFYLIHPIFHESLAKKAQSDSGLPLSHLRVRLLGQLAYRGDQDAATNLMSGMHQVGPYLGEILSHIDDDALEFLENPQGSIDFAATECDQIAIYAAEFGHSHLLRYRIANGLNVDAQDVLNGVTLLHLSASNGHDKVVELLLRNNANVSAVDYQGRTAEMLAMHSGHVNIVRLLRDNHKMNELRKRALKRLIKAARDGHQEVVQELMKEDRTIVTAADKHGRTALMAAAKHGHCTIVQLLIDRDVDVNAADQNGYTALMAPAKHGHCTIVQLLIDRDVDVNAADQMGYTALMRAARNGHVNVVQMLLEKKANVDASNKLGYTALMDAATKGHDAVVKLLIERNANIETANRWGTTALIRAAEYGHDKVVRLLLDNKANVEAADNEGQTALVRAIKSTDIWHCSRTLRQQIKRGVPKVVQQLLSHNANTDAAGEDGRTAIDLAMKWSLHSVAQIFLDSNSRDKNGRTILMKAILQGKIKMAHLLTKKKTNLDAVDKNGHTALMMEIEHGFRHGWTLALRLLDCNASVNIADNDGRNALMITTIIAGIYYEGHRRHHDCLPFLQRLLKNGANVNSGDKNGRTALMSAVDCRVMGRSQLKMVRYLLENGANVNAVDKSGRTALMWAKDPKGVQLLLASHADENAVDIHGETALMGAATNDRYSVAQLLVDRRSNVNAVDRDGGTVLMKAAVQGHADIVQLLIDAHANVDAANRAGCTALMLSARLGHGHILPLLIHAQANIDAADKDGCTALMIAAQDGRHDTVRLLIEAHARIDAIDSYGFTALMYAASGGHENVVRLLLANGASVDAADNHGWTALMRAAVNGYVGVVEILLHKNANPNAVNKACWSALMLAASNGHIDVVQMLVAADVDIGARDEDGWTAAMMAAETGHDRVVQLLESRVHETNVEL